MNFTDHGQISHIYSVSTVISIILSVQDYQKEIKNVMDSEKY